MSRQTAKFIDDPAYELFLSRLSQRSGDVIRAGLQAAANVLADEIRKHLRASIGDPTATELMGAFGVTPSSPNRAGVWSAHIGFDGYQELGSSERVAFQLIARAIESGVRSGPHKRPAKPFAKPAVSAKREEAFRAFQDAVNDKIKELEDTHG
jgi:hypothetical protein